MSHSEPGVLCSVTAALKFLIFLPLNLCSVSQAWWDNGARTEGWLHCSLLLPGSSFLLSVSVQAGCPWVWMWKGSGMACIPWHLEVGHNARHWARHKEFKEKQVLTLPILINYLIMHQLSQRNQLENL